MKRIKLYLSSLLCLILCGLQTLQANTIDAPLCTVNVSGTSLREVISIIEKQTNYHFLQSASDKVLNQPITLAEKNQVLIIRTIIHARARSCLVQIFHFNWSRQIYK